MSVGYILYKIFLRILANIYLKKNSRPNTTLKSLSFIHCQILSAIPISLKLERNTIFLSKTRCKDYYSLFQVKWETQPTSVRLWSRHYPLPPPPFTNKWNNLFKNNSKMSADKLRQFSCKLLHRILVTKKEHKRYKI